jgi:prophage regulatory protein
MVILRSKALIAKTGIPRSTRNLWINQGIFPKPIKLGARAVGWLESDIDAWLANQVETSRRRQGGQSQLKEAI